MPTVSMTVNGKAVSAEVESRTLLVQYLRQHLGLTGTHVGCDTSQCGSCVVHVDGKAVKSCMMLAVQAEGTAIETVESLGGSDGELEPLQQAFSDKHALQCGYCTPGMLMSAKHLLERNPNPTEADVRKAIQGNICRCTGYVNIVDAILEAVERSGS